MDGSRAEAPPVGWGAYSGTTRCSEPLTSSIMDRFGGDLRAGFSPSFRSEQRSRWHFLLSAIFIWPDDREFTAGSRSPITCESDNALDLKHSLFQLVPLGLCQRILPAPRCTSRNCICVYRDLFTSGDDSAMDCRDVSSSIHKNQERTRRRS